MVVWNLNPALLTIGPLEIRWYGLVYALGFYIGYLILKKSMGEKLAEEFVFIAIISSILSARIFYVFVYNPSYYLDNILQIPAVWQGGLSIHGGLLGGLIATWYWCKKHKKDFYDITDRLAALLALTLVFGRIANYVNGELPGIETTVSWCVNYPFYDGCRHPSQLYESLYSLFLFIILLVQEARNVSRGVLTWTFITLYGLFRFFITFYRLPDSTDPIFLGLAIGQWLSLAMVLVGIYWLSTRKKLQ